MLFVLVSCDGHVRAMPVFGFDVGCSRSLSPDIPTSTQECPRVTGCNEGAIIISLRSSSIVPSGEI